MVYHIVMWNFKEGIEDSKKPEILENMKTKLLALILIFTLTGFSFSQESTENPKSNIKTPEEIQEKIF